MTYKDYFVVEVKSNGKILRVRDDAVYLPFGSEYSILLKNLNSRKASVNVSVDGEDTLDNHSLIIEPNDETVLEGFLKGNVARNRFRFIQKTKQIQDHRGDKADDGMIRIEFAFAKPQPEPWIAKTIKEVHHHHHLPFTYYGSNVEWTYLNKSDSAGRGIHDGESVMYSNSMGTPVASASGPVSESNVTMDSLGIADVPHVDEGITVKGSECNQQFRYGYIGELDHPEVIVIRLKGLTQTGNQINDPITVKTKLACPTCGTKSKSSMKYCGSCGTFLE